MQSSVRVLHQGCSARPDPTSSTEQLQTLRRERRTVRREVFRSWWTWNEAQAKDPAPGKRVFLLSGVRRGAEAVVLSRKGNVLRLLLTPLGEEEGIEGCILTEHVAVAGWERHLLSPKVGVRVATRAAEKRVLRRPEVGDVHPHTRAVEDVVLNKTAKKQTRNQCIRRAAGGRRHQLAMTEARRRPSHPCPYPSSYRVGNSLPFDLGGALHV
jgi:hypothetical protein